MSNGKTVELPSLAWHKIKMCQYVVTHSQLKFTSKVRQIVFLQSTKSKWRKYITFGSIFCSLREKMYVFTKIINVLAGPVHLDHGLSSSVMFIGLSIYLTEVSLITVDINRHTRWKDPQSHRRITAQRHDGDGGHAWLYSVSVSFCLYGPAWDWVIT